MQAAIIMNYAETTQEESNCSLSSVLRSIPLMFKAAGSDASSNGQPGGMKQLVLTAQTIIPDLHKHSPLCCVVAVRWGMFFERSSLSVVHGFMVRRSYRTMLLTFRYCFTTD